MLGVECIDPSGGPLGSGIGVPWMMGRSKSRSLMGMECGSRTEADLVLGGGGSAGMGVMVVVLHPAGVGW